MSLLARRTAQSLGLYLFAEQKAARRRPCSIVDVQFGELTIE